MSEMNINSVELAKRQMELANETRAFAARVIELLGGVDDTTMTKRAMFDLANEIADTIRNFVVSHTDFTGEGK